MAKLFMGNGFPEAIEYETNYIEFDASDPRKIHKIIKIIKTVIKNPDYHYNNRGKGDRKN